MTETQTKLTGNLQAGDHIIAALTKPNMVILVEIEGDEMVLHTAGGVFKTRIDVEVEVEVATTASRVAWEGITAKWGAKEGNNRKFDRETLHAFLMDIVGRIALAEEAEAE